jgi:hypothetical protein
MMPITHRKTPERVKADLLSLSKLVHDPISEQEILDLQDQFLSPGLHYLVVQDIQMGRKIIKTFLQSINYYHDVACLTLENDALPTGVSDLHDLLDDYGFLEKSQLYMFFLDYWYYDFLWIEATDSLLHKPWFGTFSQLLDDFSLKQLPVFTVSYQ